MGRLVVVGGGCYGRYYSGQLVAARRRGKLVLDGITVVDRDPACAVARDPALAPEVDLVRAEWDAYFDDYLGPGGTAGPGDHIVPSPLMPHLFCHWLVRRAQARWPGRSIAPAPFPAPWPTPFDTAAPAPDHTRYVSFADWLCPTHCVEPAICPVIRAPRTWEMADTVARITERLMPDRPVAGPVVLACRHLTHGVGTVPVADVLAGDRLLAEAGNRSGVADVVVGTVSSCHGAVTLLHLGTT